MLFLFFFNREDLARPTNILNNTGFRVFLTMSVAFVSARILRGCSRSVNPQYKQFIQTYAYVNNALRNQHLKNEEARQLVEAKRKLREKYDFEFSHWPVDFKWSDGRYAKERQPRLLPLQDANEVALSENVFTRAISYVMAHTVGRIMLYPGSVKLLNMILDQNLTTGRRFLIENHQAKRYKLLARDQNMIDCMFIDKRETDFHRPANNGRYLVICSEGNAGFYEIGIFGAPLNHGYSVLGWNHPGFAGSTGSPYPENEVNAFEAVINFAVTELGFELENIYLFSWSIGGFPAAWAASQYPEVRGVILDASFDDILPLARSKMMPVLEPIVDSTIRNYFNLNVSAYLNLYKGPVLLIRRLSDEIIPENPHDPIRTNRGNFILLKLLKSRFPNLMQHPEVVKTVESFLNTDQPRKCFELCFADSKLTLFRLILLDLIVNRVNREETLGRIVQYIQSNNVTTYPIEMDVETVGGVEQAKNVIIFMVCVLFVVLCLRTCFPNYLLSLSPTRLIKSSKTSTLPIARLCRPRCLRNLSICSLSLGNETEALVLVVVVAWPTKIEIDSNKVACVCISYKLFSIVLVE